MVTTKRRSRAEIKKKKKEKEGNRKISQKITLKWQEETQEKKKQWRYRANETKDKMAGVSPHISIITLKAS